MAVYRVVRDHTGAILMNLEFFEDLSWSVIKEVLEGEAAKFLNEQECAEKVKNAKKVKNM